MDPTKNWAYVDFIEQLNDKEQEFINYFEPALNIQSTTGRLQAIPTSIME